MKKENDFSIREATIGDAPTLGLIRSRALDGGDPEYFLRRFETEISKFARSSESRIFVAVLAEEVIGYGRVQHYHGGQDLDDTNEPLPSGWYLRGIVVSNTHRRLGVADQLTQFRLNWLEGRTQVVHCFLDAEEKKTIPLYIRLGFNEVSRGWGFKDQTRGADSGILLRKDIPKND